MDDQRAAVRTQLENLRGAAVGNMTLLRLACGRDHVTRVERKGVNGKGGDVVQQVDFHQAKVYSQLGVALEVLALAPQQRQTCGFGSGALDAEQGGVGR